MCVCLTLDSQPSREHYKTVISSLKMLISFVASCMLRMKVLTHFCMNKLGRGERMQNGCKPQKKPLTVSHGKSSVEQGFSEKSDIVGTNMNEETLIYCIDKHKMVLRTSTNL